jgi:hypothetical protein
MRKPYIYLFILIIITAVNIAYPIEGIFDYALYLNNLKSGDPLLVQEAKDNILLHYHGLWGETEKKAIEKGIIDIIQENDGTPATVNDNLFGSNKPCNTKTALSDSKTAAILLAGSLRLTNALPALAKRINYITPGKSHLETVIPLGGPTPIDFPAAIAMKMIGEPSLPYLKEVIRVNKDRETRRLAYNTLILITGKTDPSLKNEATMVREGEEEKITVTFGYAIKADIFSKLTSDNEEIRKATKVTFAASTSEEEIRRTSLQLMAFLKFNPSLSAEVRQDLIEIIGIKKFENCIPYLVENINVISIKKPLDNTQKHQLYPSIDALSNIGKPALSSLIKALESYPGSMITSTEDGHEIDKGYASLITIRKIVGTKKTEQLLNEQLSKETREMKKTWLRNSLKMINVK